MEVQLSDKTLAFSEKIAKVTVGIDALYRKECKDLEDGLVVLNMGNVQPEPFTDYIQAREELAEMAGEAMKLPEPDRRLYYTQTCTSLSSFCQWRMGLLPQMSDQIGLFLHVDPSPVSDATMQGYFEQLHSMLTELGYEGDLKKQIDSWEQKNLVPPDEVQGYMDDLMVTARNRCGEILELPENDYYHCTTISSGPFNARSDYEQRQVVINIEPTLTRQRLKYLVCHEVYPGHFMQFSLRRIYWERGTGGLDGTLSVCNHSSSSTFEGIADAGVQFLNWEEGLDDSVNSLICTIQSALAMGASYRLHTLGWNTHDVENYLRSNAVGGGEGWIANRMEFIKDPARSSLIWSYLRGDEGVFPVWKRVSKEDRPRFFQYVYGRLHTVQSLSLFQ